MLYLAKGNSGLISDDGGTTWKRISLDASPSFVYTNDGALSNTLLAFSETAVYRIDKQSHTIVKAALPSKMSPAFSFTGGKKRGSDETIFYALHNRAPVVQGEDFGETEVWISTDGGMNWEQTSDDISNNRHNGVAPSYAMIAAAEDDAAHAYVVTDRYMEKEEDGALLHWYGALKTGDGGQQWRWVWKGGGGSGRYGVKDGKGVENLADAWVEDAF